jgi:PIN domain nuclease of toxin-antitoxin system
LLVKGLSERSTLSEIIPLTQAIAWAVQQIPREQVPDLPDRVIAATALHLGVPLISRDRQICLSNVKTIW